MPNFWDDQKAAEKQMRKVKELHYWIDSYEDIEKMVNELKLGFDFVKEGLVTEHELDEMYQKTIERFEDVELRNMLRREEDKLGAVLKINSGAGGTESQDWAQMLMRMYLRWCEKHSYKTSIVHLVEGDEAGIKSVTIQVEGDLCSIFCVMPRLSASSTASTSSPLAMRLRALASSSSRHCSVWSCTSRISETTP